MGQAKIGLVLWHDKWKVSNKETGKKQQCYCRNAGESESDGFRLHGGSGFKKNDETERGCKE